MRLIAVLIVTGSLFVSASAIAQQTPEIPSLSNDQVTRLNSGEILVEVVASERPIGDVLGVVDAPAQQVLDVITDFDHYTEFMPNMGASSIIERDGDTYVCSGITDTPWPMDDRIWTIRAWAGPQEIGGINALVSTWDYVPDSGNLVDTEGYWLLLPWGDDGSQTLVRYYLMADLGTWVPDVILNWATENMLPDMITAIKERVAG